MSEAQIIVVMIVWLAVAVLILEWIKGSD